MTGEVSFSTLGVEDAERGRRFYGRLFGWTFEPAPSGGGYEVTSTEVRGGIHGGDPGASPYLFFEVEDFDAAIDRVRALGGQIEKVDQGEEDEASVARFGRFELCRDDQGSPFGLHQPPRGA
jgi:predicted enzyme related to lactoylglutathione lyase